MMGAGANCSGFREYQFIQELCSTDEDELSRLELNFLPFIGSNAGGQLCQKAIRRFPFGFCLFEVRVSNAISPLIASELKFQNSVVLTRYGLLYAVRSSVPVMDAINALRLAVQ